MVLDLERPFFQLHMEMTKILVEVEATIFSYSNLEELSDEEDDDDDELGEEMGEGGESILYLRRTALGKRTRPPLSSM